MSATKRNTPPDTTIFNINPNTGKPYMTPEHALMLARKHVSMKGKNIPTRCGDFEDLVNDCLCKLSAYDYDPVKSAPTTFAIMIFTSVLGKHIQLFNNAGRCLETPDRIIMSDGEEQGYATDLVGVEAVTPETSLLVKETVIEKTLNNESVDECKSPKTTRSRKYYLKNKERIKSMSRKWAAANSDKVKGYRKRHAQKRKAKACHSS